MANTHITTLDTRPSLTVEHTGGKKLGNCYHATFYRVTSKDRLTRAKLDALRTVGVLGYGQGFYVNSQCDGKEAPADVEMLPWVAKDDAGKVVDFDPINIYSGKPYAPSARPYYVYECEDRCDSGD